jgi:hypothetical protein
MSIDTSRTSRNMVPHLHKFVVANYAPGTRVLDYGCGRYQTGMDYLRHRGFEVVGIDPHALPEAVNDHNEQVVRQGWERAQIVLVSNVLNVIPDYEDRCEALRRALSFVRRPGLVLVTVYEGSRDGVSGETRDGWQENRSTGSYLDTECQSDAVRLANGVDVRKLTGKVIALRKIPGF